MGMLFNLSQFFINDSHLNLLVVEVGSVALALAFFLFILLISPIKLVTRYTSLFVILVSIVFFLFIIFNTLDFESVGLNLYFSNLNQVVKALSFLCLIGFSLASMNFSTSVFTFEYIMLIFFSQIAGLFILSFNHLPLLFLLIEVQALIGYTLVVYRRKSQTSTEAGMKYFLLGSISSGLMVFGITLLYGSLGSFSLLDLSLNSSEALSYNLKLLGSLSLVFGLIFKLSGAPLHFWTPEVYENVEFVTLSYFGSIPKFPVLALLTGQASFLVEAFREIFLFTGVLSLVIGGVSGLFQDSIKKIFAYSTIANTGYLLVLFSALKSDIEFFSINLSALAIWCQMGVYSLSVIALSSFLQSLLNGSEFDSLLSLTYTSPMVRLSFLLLLVSLSGIPPTAGFFAKFLLLYSVSSISLVVIIMFTSVLSLFYYMRIAGTVFFYTREHEFFSPVELTFKERNSFFTFFFYPVSILNLGLFLLPFTIIL